MIDTVETLQKEIDDLAKQVNTLTKRIIALRTRRDKIILEANRPYFNSIEWLINNPDTPGQYEAMKKWIETSFGGEYRGVIPSGYNSLTEQQNFSIMLGEGYDDNVKAFFDSCLSVFKPDKDGFVSFQYCSGLHSGLYSLSYQPSTGTWWTTRIRYGRTVEETQHTSLDDAIQEAIRIEETVND